MSYTVAEERMQNYIEELEQENRLLRARNDRLEAQRQWVGLTTEEIYACDETSGLPQHEITNADLQAFAYAIEAKLKDNNS